MEFLDFLKEFQTSIATGGIIAGIAAVFQLIPVQTIKHAGQQVGMFLGVLVWKTIVKWVNMLP